VRHPIRKPRDLSESRGGVRKDRGGFMAFLPDSAQRSGGGLGDAEAVVNTVKLALE
jgi:hypothetical protein